MKIGYAVVASDDNPMYLDFWPIVSKLWKRLGITPVLLYFGNGKPSEEHGVVLRMLQREDLPLATCWARYWFAAHSENADETIIISDIDMLPFSRWYFVDQLEKFDDNEYVHLNPCIETYTRLPSCYHVAKGSRFKEMLELPDDFDESFRVLKSQNYNNENDYKATGHRQWCYDEFYASELLLKKDSVLMLKRDGGESGHRIDRTNWVYDENKMRAEGYYDSHSIRPYAENKQQIDKLIELLP